VFNRRRLEWLETVALIHFLYDANDVLTPPDVGGKKVAHAPRWLGLGCHLTAALYLLVMLSFERRLERALVPRDAAADKSAF
jgi:hypothetical protein